MQKCHHISEFEENKAIFDTLIALIMRPTTMLNPEPLVSTEAIDLNNEEVLV